MASPKKPAKAKATMKQLPIRLTPANWQKMQLAKLQTNSASMQAISLEAYDLWLKKNKLDPLDPQGEAE
ncbi:TPA: hypothetical protein ACKQCJ_001129 [Stenotrophomonas maltophilia]|jgi:hypothetical protein|uniref:Uncharacterized protein n=1 Tax=Stenotrophomonas maltophilia TaxID=40324 RepID=A0AAI9CJQ1_STEMA|nr:MULTISPECIES: hypothetical protein [Stenotrophomonas]EKU9962504.1 hypothetical protein [Stenotrophomonas maltophilia]EKZ1926522.1 hypothetical protein [Stenotrophomonas maltophilia]ELE7121284.1 hypothetical protein [Stenotrophomonas maltophilia]EMB2747212.1 hypothetical protein [Stenotrophomonas maltophilia]EMI47554.1 hypothetical protein C405_21129 [Stenotrophomonas maltophilia AU12-09]